jgi:glutathione S-transferase
MLTLYDDVFSPYARKVRIALYEKGVAFERVRALHGDCNRTDFVHVNPRAEVPALVDGDFSLFDSTVICEYLEDRYPAPPIYPRDPQRRAACRLLEDVADTQFDAATLRGRHRGDGPTRATFRHARCRRPGPSSALR